MRLSKIHLFFFVLLCTMVSVMSVQFQPPMVAHHHDGGVGCYGRRARPNNGNAGGGTDGGNNNNGQTNGDNADGQNGDTEQI